MSLMTEVQKPDVPDALKRGDGRAKKPREVQPRWPGARAMWRRIKDNPGSFHAIQQLGANESLGTQLGILFAENHLSEAQANAGRHFAEMCGKYDRHHGITARGLRSPAYDAGFGGRNDEVALAERTGTIKDYERQAKKIKKKWRKACDEIGNQRMLSLLEEVCIADRHCPAAEIPLLRAGLELLAQRWAFVEPQRNEIKVSHVPGARLGSRGRR